MLAPSVPLFCKMKCIHRDRVTLLVEWANEELRKGNNVKRAEMPRYENECNPKLRLKNTI